MTDCRVSKISIRCRPHRVREANPNAIAKTRCKIPAIPTQTPNIFKIPSLKVARYSIEYGSSTTSSCHRSPNTPLCAAAAPALPLNHPELKAPQRSHAMPA